MRRSLARLPYRPVIGRSAAALSTSSGGGRGRGGPINHQFTANESHPGNPKQDENDTVPPHGRGRGRGESVPPPVFTNSNSNRPPIGRGRGFSVPQSPPLRDEQKPDSAKIGNRVKSMEEVEVKPVLPGDLLNSVSGGAGRGKITGTSTSVDEKNPALENRHLRQRPPPEARPPSQTGASAADAVSKTTGPELTQEEKTRKAVEILSKAFRDAGGPGGDGRGRGGRRGREKVVFSDGEEYDDEDFHAGERYRVRDEDWDSDDDESGSESEGDPDWDNLEEEFGAEKFAAVSDYIDEVSESVAPDKEDTAYLDALETNFMLECEPEYFMEEFGTNPDIEDKPMIPLHEALEKMKPFFMLQHGLSDEEWKEAVKDTMKAAPLMKKIVDDYGGPDRITAKQQQKELESVANTLPASAPASLKHFTDRAVLSLQSNPGWGFDAKCQFMDRLVREVSKQYK